MTAEEIDRHLSIINRRIKETPHLRDRLGGWQNILRGGQDALNAPLPPRKRGDDR